jgi:hypothetical protein
MPSIINASTAGAGGVITTADASGVLELQSGGTTALTLNGANATSSGTVTATAFVGNGSALTGIAGGFGNMQVFTSSGTFNVPAGITKAKVTVVGGGGNGGTYGGGGGGGAAIEVVTGLTPGGTVTVTVGGAGGTSSFGAFCSATGGANGSSSANGNGGAGGVGSGGNLNLRGNAGGCALSGVSTGGFAGSSILGGAGQLFYAAAGGAAQANSGSGGAGGNGTGNAAGGSGVVFVEY